MSETAVNPQGRRTLNQNPNPDSVPRSGLQVCPDQRQRANDRRPPTPSLPYGRQLRSADSTIMLAKPIPGGV